MDATLYLPENVLNERNPVTYRSLSRALKVHANRAKQILYEFHRNENAKKPQSVRATYVITGIQKPRAAFAPCTNGHVREQDGEMQKHPRIRKSIPEQASTSLIPYTTSIILAREEELDDAKASFRSISTIQVYSLHSAILEDLDVLCEVTQDALAAHAQDDPLECGSQWGMIQNKHVTRRSGARPPPPPAPAPKTETKAESKVKLESTVPAKRLFQTEKAVKEDSGASDSKPNPSSANNSDASSKPAKPAPKHAKGSLFSSFAKAKPKTKATPASESATSTPGEDKDIVLNDASDGEEQAELFPESRDKPASEIRESKKQREEKLKQMMEDEDADDEEMPDADDEEPEEPERELTPMEETPVPKPTELKEEVTVQGGRRRGKRQVMKKRTVKDDEGYLVTREEPTWESFSEDEPAPPKKKPAVNVPKSNKGGKPGQGNIMSFFGKPKA